MNMSKIKLGKRTFMILLFTFVFLLLYSPESFPLAFITNPSISPDVIYTTNNITCSWNLTNDATSWTATWYINGNPVKNYSFSNASPGYEMVLESNYTKKGDIINCSVNATDGTSYVFSSASKTVNNSRPSSIELYYKSNSGWVRVVSNITIDEDKLAIFDINGSDPDNDSLTYSFSRLVPSSQPTNYSFDSQNGFFNWTPTHGEVGNNKFSFSVIDDEGLGLVNVYNITVIEINDKPYFDPALQDQHVVEGNCSWSYTINATDEETPNGPFNFSIVDVSPALSSNLTITKVSNTSALIKFDPCPSYFDKGNHTVTIQLTELNNSPGLPLESANYSFKIEVTTVNHAPEIHASNYTNGTQGQAFYFSFNATDLDNDTISFSLYPKECTSNITNPWNNYLSTTMSYNYNSTNSSLAVGTINISATNFTNDFVVCSGKIDIIASDGKENSTFTVYFNISNINDPPYINETSPYNNYLNQKNMSNLTAYTNTFFYYRVYATDEDLFLSPRYNEVLNFSSNDSSIPIDPATGWINFTPNSTMLGDHVINITVTDKAGATYSRILTLHIKNNTPPQIVNISFYRNNTLVFKKSANNVTSLNLFEDIISYIDVDSLDAEDCPTTPDCNLTYSYSITKLEPQNYSNRNLSISLNSTTGNYTISPDYFTIGKYLLEIKVRDTLMSETKKNITLIINYSNDKPDIYKVDTPSKIVEGHPAIIKVYANDEDLSMPLSFINQSKYGAFNESLTLYTNISWQHNITKTSNKTWDISFTPTSAEIGNHTIKIWVNDSKNNSCTNCTGNASYIINIEILSKTQDPRIENISIYDVNNSNYILSPTSVWNPDVSELTVNTSENRTILINTTGWNDEYNYKDLNFTWIYDNNTLTTTGTYYRYFDLDFFSSGSHNITIIVEDTRLNKDNVTIHLNVANINRKPTLLNPLINLTGNKSVNPVYEDPRYFVGIWNSSNVSKTAYFYDPDLEDLNITIINTTCEGIADIKINGTGIKVYGRQLGNCTALFRAKDPYNAYKDSNLVHIEVTDTLPQENVNQPTSGGGGGASSQTIAVPIPEEIETPDPVNIVAPALITIYSNKSIKIPIIVNNTWNDDIYGVTLDAEANVSNVSLHFNVSKFEIIPKGTYKRVSLIVTNYRLGENFEVVVSAKVTEPDFTDKALIMINSLEAAKMGEDIKTKVTFARDLLGNNPECIELNELLDEAEKFAAEGNYEEAQKLIKSVIEGCKYLISKARSNKETPKTLESYFRERILKNPNVWLSALLFTTLLALILIETYRVIKSKGKIEKE